VLATTSGAGLAYVAAASISTAGLAIALRRAR
jgi:hypothetical protein